jgi:hypothetical protein
MEKLSEAVKELMAYGLSIRTITKMCKDVYHEYHRQEILDKHGSEELED